MKMFILKMLDNVEKQKKKIKLPIIPLSKNNYFAWSVHQTGCMFAPKEANILME